MTKEKERNVVIRKSNFELLRIFAMFLIVASHWGYMTNGVDMQVATQSNYLFYAMFRSFGQVGVTLFIFISGYFLCKSKFKINSFVRLLCQQIFYVLLTFGIACIIRPILYGEDFFTFNNLLKSLTIFSGNYWFLAFYYIIFLIHPFINKMIEKLNQKQFLFLLIVLFFCCVIMPSISMRALNNCSAFVFWIFAYLVGSFLRLNPNVLKNKWFTIIGLGIALCAKFLFFLYFQYTSEFRNTVCCFFISLYIFVLFRDLKIESKFINVIASSMLGVYLLHEPEFLRYTIWQDVIDMNSMMGEWYFILVSIGYTLGVFVVCICIELLRKYLLERPIFKRIENKFNATFEKVNTFFPTVENIECENKIQFFDLNVLIMMMTIIVVSIFTLGGWVEYILGEYLFLAVSVVVWSIWYLVYKVFLNTDNSNRDVKETKKKANKSNNE
ncbi:MAG: acyltransferase [Clostridia bacterium]|nr:acyltransferase [Clostridia bacterium]